MSSRQVAKNSFWNIVELSLGIFTVLTASVILSRAFGPERLGYYNYLVWLTYVTGMLSTGGLPMSTLKFMTEFLGQGEPGTAWLIYRMAWRLQLAFSLLPLVIGLPAVWLWAPVEHRWVAILLVFNMIPRMLSSIPAQVNSASQELRRNVPSTMASNLVTLIVIVLTVYYDWGLLGLAFSHPAGTVVDLAGKLYLTADRLRIWRSAVPPGAVLDAELRARFRRFATQGLGLQILAIAVWDRSDIFLLRHLNADMRQISFFSYSFTLVEKLLLIPQAIGGAMGLNLMAGQALERRRMAATAVSSGIYLLLIGVPALLGIAALATPVWKMFGDKFAPAVPVFIVMAILAIWRTIQYPASMLLQATDNQRFLLIITVTCAAVNLVLDGVLIPSQGAMGAAIGNGAGQALAVAGAWAFIGWRFRTSLMLAVAGRIVLSGLIMALVVWKVTQPLPAIPAILVGVPAGVIVYAGMLRLTRALREEDRRRLESLTGALPAALRSPLHRMLWHLIPGAPGQRTGNLVR